MSITSIAYLIFCSVLIFLYFTVMKKHQWILLLIASILFYFINCSEYFFFVIITIVVTYLATNKISKIYKTTSSKKAAKHHAKQILLIQLLFSVGVLIYVKYTNFLIYEGLGLMGIFGYSSDNIYLNIIAPLGVSFYTFAIVGYTLDVYWKRIQPETNIFKLALFTIYFPQILMGPIPRFKTLMPQLEAHHEFDYERMKQGLLLTGYGLIKKLILANRIFYFVDPYFDTISGNSGYLYILIMMFYSIGGYADFSGSIDIVSGISKIMGVDLDPNFNHPYFSKNMTEFWQRWHISLNTWFRDYVLYPVSISSLEKKINRFNKKHFTKSKVRTLKNMLPLAVVWILTGLWHGAAFTFLLWGFYHFLLLASSLLFENQFKALNKFLHINESSKWFKLWQMFRTFMLCTIGRIFFRPDSLGDSLYIFKTLFTTGSINIGDFISNNVFIILFYMLVLLFVSIIQERRGSMYVWLEERSLPVRWCFYYFLIFSSIAVGFYGPGLGDLGFAYQDF